MKKLSVIILALAALALSSCEELAQALMDSTVYTFAGNTVYEGQTAFLGTVGNTKVGWEIKKGDEQYVTLNYDENGKNCIAQFGLGMDASKQRKIQITTKNLDDETKEPYVGEITIAPWRLRAFKKNSDGSEKEITTSPVKFSTEGAGTYVVKMQYLNDKGEWANVGSVLYKVDLTDVKGSGHNVVWSSSDTKVITKPTRTVDTTKELVFTETMISALSSRTYIYVTMGKDRDEKGKELDPTTDSRKVTHSLIFDK